MTRAVTNVAVSIRQKLLNLSRAKGEVFDTVSTRYALERFLYRLGKSSYAVTFVLKGAMLFRAWTGMVHRPTKDLDLRVFLEPPLLTAAKGTDFGPTWPAGGPWEGE